MSWIRTLNAIALAMVSQVFCIIRNYKVAILLSIQGDGRMGQGNEVSWTAGLRPLAWALVFDRETKCVRRGTGIKNGDIVITCPLWHLDWEERARAKKGPLEMAGRGGSPRIESKMAINSIMHMK
jgi:hypothetical protein